MAYPTSGDMIMANPAIELARYTSPIRFIRTIDATGPNKTFRRWSGAKINPYVGYQPLPRERMLPTDVKLSVDPVFSSYELSRSEADHYGAAQLIDYYAGTQQETANNYIIYEQTMLLKTLKPSSVPENMSVAWNVDETGKADVTLRANKLLQRLDALKSKILSQGNLSHLEFLVFAPQGLQASIISSDVMSYKETGVPLAFNNENYLITRNGYKFVFLPESVYTAETGYTHAVDGKAYDNATYLMMIPSSNLLRGVTTNGTGGEIFQILMYEDYHT